MPKPAFIINGHDYGPCIVKLTVTRNDLDADGSGRDVQSGLMYRTRIAQKAKLDVELGNMKDSDFLMLLSDIDPTFFNVRYLDPLTNTRQTKTFYTAEVNVGSQRYSPGDGVTYYSDASFSITER